MSVSVLVNVLETRQARTSSTIHATSEMEPEIPDRASSGLKAVVVEESPPVAAAAARSP